MVDSSSLSDDRGEEAADAGRLAEAKAVAESVSDAVIAKWERVLAGKGHRNELCGFCALCSGLVCSKCPVYTVFSTTCGDVLEGRDAHDVLDLLADYKAELLAATEKFVLEHDITLEEWETHG